VPSKANAESLAAELPIHEPGRCRVLYPASLKAQKTLQDGLLARGAFVERLNTYSTEPVTQVPEDALQRALDCSVVSIASPSALKAWVGLVGIDTARRKPLACIGSTSGTAALRAGWDEQQVFWEDMPGMDGFVSSIDAALRWAEDSQCVS
jgi:uroporphyrinogen-III synthase